MLPSGDERRNIAVEILKQMLRNQTLIMQVLWKDMTEGEQKEAGENIMRTLNILGK